MNFVTFWGLIILAKLCQMSGQPISARVLAALAASIVAVEVWRWVSDIRVRRKRLEQRRRLAQRLRGKPVRVEDPDEAIL